MKEIQSVVNDTVATMLSDGTVEKLIATNVQKAIETAITDNFRSYGGITKQISTAIEEGLKINPSDIDFQSYNEQMLVAVKTKLGNLFAGAASERFLSEIDDVLKPAPESISLKEIVEFIVKDWREDEFETDGDDEATVETETSTYGSVSVKLWKERTSRYGSSSPALEFYLSGAKGEGLRVRINHRHSYNPTCFSTTEAFLFKLYAAGTVITDVEDFDAYDCDLTLKTDEYY
jgi:hypothetical protein